MSGRKWNSKSNLAIISFLCSGLWDRTEGLVPLSNFKVVYLVRLLRIRRGLQQYRAAVRWWWLTSPGRTDPYITHLVPPPGQWDFKAKIRLNLFNRVQDSAGNVNFCVLPSTGCVNFCALPSTGCVNLCVLLKKKSTVYTLHSCAYV